MTVRRSLLIVCVAAGCGGGPAVAPDAGVDASPDAPPDAAEPGPTDRFAFADIRCLPDVAAGDTAVEGQRVTCSLAVQGTSASGVTLGCEDAQGRDIDCGPLGEHHLAPVGPSPLPVDGSFSAATTGRAGSSLVVVWVARDDDGFAEHRFEAAVIADDGINEAPAIAVDCGGQDPGAVTVQAGAQLACTLQLTDPDPDVLTWSFAQTDGDPPVNNPSPSSGIEAAPAVVAWQWQTDAADVGARTFTFEASDQEAAPVTAAVTVTVTP